VHDIYFNNDVDVLFFPTNTKPIGMRAMFEFIDSNIDAFKRIRRIAIHNVAIGRWASFFSGNYLVNCNLNHFKGLEELVIYEGIWYGDEVSDPFEYCLHDQGHSRKRQDIGQAAIDFEEQRRRELINDYRKRHNIAPKSTSIEARWLQLCWDCSHKAGGHLKKENIVIRLIPKEDNALLCLPEGFDLA